MRNRIWGRVFTIAIGAMVSIWMLALLAPASVALAEEGNRIVDVVKAGSECPSAVSTQPAPVFTTGDTVAVCLGGLVPDGAIADITVGQLHAAVGEAIGNSLIASLPEEPTEGGYAVGGTLNNLPLTPFLIRFFPTSRPRLLDMSPTTASRGAQVRINGDGLLAPLSATRVSFGDEIVKADAIAQDGSWVVATIPPAAQSATGGPKNVGVSIWDVPATPPASGLVLTVRQPVSADITVKIAGIAALPFVALGILVAGLYFAQKSDSGRPRNLIAGLMLEPESKTYSLSRAQFFWWLIIIGFAYTFLFVGHGVIAGDWSFPPLAGYAYTLLISSGTLLLATVTSNAKGQKGSGTVNPSISDLIVHGGVVAPERVQQVVWTVLAGVGLLWIVFNTYATATSLPDVPTELLTLMGLSSAAYVGGKLVRDPGPIIKQVDTDSQKADTVQLVVSGDSLSRDASVLLDDVPVSRDEIHVEKPDPTDLRFALQLRLETDLSPTEWASRAHTIVVVNSDAQRSEWTGPNSASLPKLQPASSVPANGSVPAPAGGAALPSA